MFKKLFFAFWSQAWMHSVGICFQRCFASSLCSYFILRKASCMVRSSCMGQVWGDEGCASRQIDTCQRGWGGCTFLSLSPKSAPFSPGIGRLTHWEGMCLCRCQDCIIPQPPLTPEGKKCALCSLYWPVVGVERHRHTWRRKSKNPSPVFKPQVAALATCCSWYFCSSGWRWVGAAHGLWGGTCFSRKLSSHPSNVMRTGVNLRGCLLHCAGLGLQLTHWPVGSV